MPSDSAPCRFSREQLLEALLSAEAHVVRQQGHGRHTQDKVDANEWLAKYGPMMRELRGYNRGKVLN